MIRKISAQYIYTCKSKPLKHGIICIDNSGKITDIIDTNGQLKESGGVEFYNGIICPGFINAHCHIELSHLKGKIPEKKGMAFFVDNIIKIRSDFTNDEIKSAIVNSDKEMQDNGIVAVGDISNSNDSVEIKKKNNLFYHTFIEVFGLDENKADDIINGGIVLINEYQNNQLSCSITPHAPYSVSELLFEKFKEYYKNKKQTISVHNQECKEENEIFAGKSNDFKELLNKILPNNSQQLKVN
ncbi:amidohydrolase family protein [Bacteroidota bacterium]